jgi:hypothetical protein
MSCHTDISQWVQLARRQMAASPDYSHDPLCATDKGIQDSQIVLDKIAVALRNLDRHMETMP